MDGDGDPAPLISLAAADAGGDGDMELDVTAEQEGGLGDLSPPPPLQWPLLMLPAGLFPFCSFLNFIRLFWNQILI